MITLESPCAAPLVVCTCVPRYCEYPAAARLAPGAAFSGPDVANRTVAPEAMAMAEVMSVPNPPTAAVVGVAYVDVTALFSATPDGSVPAVWAKRPANTFEKVPENFP